VAVLAFNHDHGVVWILRVVDGENDDGAVVANDVTDALYATGFDDVVGVDGKDVALVG